MRFTNRGEKLKQHIKKKKHESPEQRSEVGECVGSRGGDSVPGGPTGR